MLARVLLCSPLFTFACLHVFNHVHSCLPMFTLVYLCSPMFTIVYLRLLLFTNVNSCLPMSTTVYLCEISKVCPCFFVFAYFYNNCLTIFTRVYIRLPVFSFLSVYLFFFMFILV